MPSCDNAARPSTTTGTFGPLACTIVTNGHDHESSKLAIVLCHGVGSRPDDLAPVGRYLFRRFPLLRGRARFVFPRGPVIHQALPMSSTWSWWPSRPAAGALEQRPNGLLESRRALMEAIESICHRWSIGPGDLIVGGFSQGAAAAIDAGLHLRSAPHLLLAFAGHGVADAGWEDRILGRRIRVLQTHGFSDTGTPFFRGVELRALLERSGASVEFLEFDGPHTIPRQGLDRLGELLVEIATQS